MCFAAYAPNTMQLKSHDCDNNQKTNWFIDTENKLKTKKKKTAMKLTIGAQRNKIKKIQQQQVIPYDHDYETAYIISSKWYRKWYKIPNSTILSSQSTDLSVLCINNSDLLSSNDNTINNRKNSDNIIQIPSNYLHDNLRPNMKFNDDYIILSKPAYTQLKNGDAK
eukprot:543670_1